MKSRRNGRGFTLIELLIVVAIIGIIAAIAIPNLLAALQRAKQKRTMSDMRALGLSLQQYNTDYGGFPGGATIDVVVKYLGNDPFKGSPKQDAWHTPYLWIPLGTTLSWGGVPNYEVWSFGKNLAQDGLTAPYTHYFDCDLVYSDGTFTQSPEGVQKT